MKAKKVFAWILAFVMLFQLALPAFAEGDETSFTVTFDNGDGNKSTVTVVADQGDAIGKFGVLAQPKDPTRADADGKHFVFYQWVNKDGNRFFEKGEATIDGDVTVIAQWKEYLAEGYQLVVNTANGPEYRTDTTKTITELTGNDTFLRIEAITSESSLRKGNNDPVAVAKIGDMTYTTLQAALNEGGIVTLIANVSGSFTITKDVTLTAENGAEITGSGTTALLINASNVTVSLNNVVIKKGASRGVGIAQDITGVTLNITGGSIAASSYALDTRPGADNATVTISGTDLDGYAAMNIWGNNGTFNISNAKLLGANTATQSSSNDFAVIALEADTTARGANDALAGKYADGNKITLTNCEIGATTNGNKQSIIVYNAYGEDLDKPARPNAATYLATGKHAKNNTVTFSSCVVNTAGDLVYDGASVLAGGNATSITETYGNKFTITGGTFSVDPSAYLADGYKATETSGSWTVSAIVYEAQNVETGVKYESLQTAIDNATAGDTIKLLKDINSSTKISVDKSITIDGQSQYTIAVTSTTENRVIDISSTTDVTLTLKNVTVDASNCKLSETRGVSMYHNTNVKLVVDGTTIKCPYYAINVAGANNGVTVEVKNSSVAAGWAGINVWSPATITVSGSTVSGINDKTHNTAGWNNFSTVVMNHDNSNSTNGSVLTFTNTTIIAETKTGNAQWLVDLRDGGIKASFTECTFESKGTPVGDNCPDALFCFGGDNEVTLTDCTIKKDDTAITTIEGLFGGIRFTSYPALYSTYVFDGIQYAVMTDGNVLAAVPTITRDNEYKVIGGTFYNDPSAYVADGYAVYPSGGKFVVAAEDAAVAKIGEVGYLTLQDAVDVGGEVKLLKNVVLDDQVEVTKTVTLDLNDKTISNTKDIWAGNNWSLISVQNGGDLTITGEGKLDAKANDCYALDVRDGAKLTIKNGEFVGNVSTVYAYEGTVTIEGGKYSIKQLSPNNDYRFTLNCLDANNQNGTAKFIVKGGSFYKFDPSSSNSENPLANFVAAGYDTKADGDYYTVAPHEHTYGEPTWIWRRTNGSWAAAATFTCVKGDDKQNVRATITQKEQEGVVTYTATVEFNGEKYTCDETKSEYKSYVVTFEGGQVGVYSWGELCTLTADGNKKWYFGEDNEKTLVADGRSTFTFAVTANTYVTTEATEAANPVAVISATLETKNSGTAVYNVKWSLPTGAQVISAAIYRGAKGTSEVATRELLESKGIRIDTGLNVRNGDFTLNITNLTPSKYQNVITVIKYSIDGEQFELVAPVMNIQANGSATSNTVN